MPDLRPALERIDAYQQRHRPVAFAVAVAKKFGDDRGGNLTALLTYYGFVSLFPLLLVGVTVLGYVLDGNTELQQRIVDSALANFPILGDQIQANVATVRGSGLALVVGSVFVLYGGLGIANVTQHALNRIWGVPDHQRPGFVPRNLRSLALVGVLGIGVVSATATSTVGNRVAPNALTSAAIAIVTIAFNTGVFLLTFQFAIAKRVPWRLLFPGSIAAGVAWELLQRLGGFYVSRVLQGMSQVYGLFALVLGLLAWISIQARVVLYAAEINTVKAHRLWPRSILDPAPDRTYEL